MFKLRRGHTYRVYDWGRVTIAFDPERSGGYSPHISVHYRQPKGPYIMYRHFNIPVPVVGFARAYQLRKVGMLKVYSIQARLVYRMFSLR